MCGGGGGEDEAAGGGVGGAGIIMVVLCTQTARPTAYGCRSESVPMTTVTLSFALSTLIARSSTMQLLDRHWTIDPVPLTTRNGHGLLDSHLPL